MATHSSVLAWRISGTGEPGGLPSMGLHRVGRDWSDLAAAYRWLIFEFDIKEDNYNGILFSWKFCCSVAKLCPTPYNPMDCNVPGFPVLYSLPVCSNSCPLNQWCYPTTSSSVALFSSCPQSFPALGIFPMSWLFASDDQTTGASASVLPISILGWFPLRLLGLISLLSKGLSRVFSSTTIRKHQFFRAKTSLWSNSHILTWLLEKL